MSFDFWLNLVSNINNINSQSEQLNFHSNLLIYYYQYKYLNNHNDSYYTHTQKLHNHIIKILTFKHFQIK